MKKVGLSILGVCVVLFFFSGFSFARNSEEVYQFVRVVDGDTLVVKKSFFSREEKVRLLGINSPESVDPRREVECFGKEASKHIKRLIGGNKKLTLEFEEHRERFDKHGRLLAYVYAGDEFLNYAMIEDGYAYEYTYKTPYSYQKSFKDAQKKAHNNSYGLWGEC